ncbi:GDP-mannose 4,6-dehydratase [Candidatus Ponderosibacter sp. Uisw_141_02]|uniref:GDP-mannose 4,6-dehydratase n=1 Tax=Candidatus Ponderosibacter sp. Uisw_141_02 TaxID=3231000 RepID=UPI003D496D57
MIKFAVIGSNSFSGSNFVRFILKKGISVDGFSRSEEPNECFLPYKWEDSQNFQFHQADLNKDLKKVVEVISDRKIDYVVNFAAQSMVAESWVNPVHWFQTNVVSTIALHEELRKLSTIKKYVHITTPEVYGSCSGYVNETQSFNPTTPYAVSRAAADLNLNAYHKAYGFPFVSTRAANVYGPGQQLYRIIPKTIMCILNGEKLYLHGGGKSRRSFIHIDDVSNATYRVALSGEIGSTYHIATNDLISIEELVNTICKMMDVDFQDHVLSAPERLGKDDAYMLDSSKIREQLNWDDKIKIGDGLEGCVQWVLENLEDLKKAPTKYNHKA